MFKLIRVLVTRGIALGIGFALGVYLLPILIAPETAGKNAVAGGTEQAIYRAEFRRDLPSATFYTGAKAKSRSRLTRSDSARRWHRDPITSFT